jgi:hypothetical protein
VSELHAAVAAAQEQRLLPLDLACGRLLPSDPRFEWLLEHGATEAQLLALARAAPRWDVLGVNFYPWSSRWHVRQRNGHLRSITHAPASDLGVVLRLVHGRYGLPMMVTETSAPGTHLERALWMRETVAAVRQARVEGIPVLGYTWFPLFTMVDWKYRSSRKAKEHHLLHLGLYDVNGHAGRMDREPTPLVEAYRQFAADPSGAIGEWTDPAAPTPGLVA